MEKKNESLCSSVSYCNSSEDDDGSKFQIWEKHSLKGLRSSGNHSDDNVHRMQEQSQCHE